MHKFLMVWTLMLLTAAAQADWPINVITALSQEDPVYKGLQHFKEGVERRTRQEVTVRIFYGSQLGSDEDILEQARAGANVAVLIDGGRLSVYTKELGILAGPYLVTGAAQSRELVTSPLFETWAQALKHSAGLQVLSFNWWQGERHMLTQKPVTKPADLTGVRVRTIGAPMFLETVSAMGASPTPISWAEIYPGLQQKVIDGAEAQHSASFSSRLYEVVTHITKTSHINLMTGLVSGSRWFDKLPAHLQKIVREEALAAGDYATQLTLSALSGYEAEMRARGVTISEIDTAPFIEATAGVYEKLGYTEIRRQVQRQLDNAMKN